MANEQTKQSTTVAGNFSKTAAHAREGVTFNQEKPSWWRIAMLVAVVVVPVLIALLLLLAVLDPYGNMNQVPAVVVNHDRGAQIDGTERNVGQELCDTLINDNSQAVEGEISGFAWKFTSDESAAAQGLRDGAYYLEIVIPEDFSETIATVGDADAIQAEVQVYYNPVLNYNAEKVGENVVASILGALNAKIQDECFSNIFVSIKEASDDLLTVANAGRDLTDGLGQARDGTASLADGTEQLASGSATLTDGLYTAADGAEQLADGADQLASGVTQLADGLGLLKDKLEQSSSTTGTAGLSQALMSVAANLKLFGIEAAKENPDQDLEQAYLDAAAQAAQSAAEANKTLGDPLVAYISGGSFTYTSGSVTVTSTEQGLIPALAEYVRAEQELEKFETEELQPLLEELSELLDEVDELGEVGQAAKADIEAYSEAVLEYAARGVEYRCAVAEYATALEQYQAGEITAEELAAYKDAAEEAQSAMDDAKEAVSTAREQVKYDLYHEDEEGNPAGLIPALKNVGDKAYDIISHLGSFIEVDQFINRLMTLITNEATAGAAAQGAAGKCEGYLVGVAVTSSYVSGSMSQLTEAIGTIYAAVAGGSGGTSLLDGTTQLSSGATSLAEGVYTAADGSNTITVNLGTVASGASTLYSGLATATSTSDTLFTGLSDGQKDLAASTENSEEHTEVLKSPVAAAENDITSVATLGTSAAPYYLGAALWIGLILATLVLRPINERRFGKQVSSFRIVWEGYLPLAGIAVAQIIIGLAVLQVGLSLPVAFPVEYYLFGILAALSSAVIVQFICGHFHLGGVIAAVVVLAAQLCVASGLFPVEAGLAVLSKVGALLPLTYIVRGLRIAMCGMASSAMILPAVVLLAFVVVFGALSVLVTFLRRKKAQADAESGRLGAHADLVIEHDS